MWSELEETPAGDVVLVWTELSERGNWSGAGVCVHHGDMTCLYHHNTQKDRLEPNCRPHKTRACILTYVQSTDAHLHIEMVYIIVHALDTLTGTG